jgi:nitroreductase
LGRIPGKTLYLEKTTMMDLTIVDKLLTTTRSVRKRLDLARPVEPEIVEQCVAIAVQAPSGGNRQPWHFLVITDPDKKAQIAEYYRESFMDYIGPLRARAESENSGVTRAPQVNRALGSAMFLAEHMQDVPVLIIGCTDGRPETATSIRLASMYGSILPAMWSLMLALRARGLGAAWTTLHLRYEQEIAALLGIPDTITQVVLMPVAYFTGEDFKPAQRNDPKTLTYWDTWGETRS